MPMSSNVKLIGCSLGIFVCYFYYGILQEKITKTKYGANKEPFTYFQAMVFVQCVINALFSLGVLTFNKTEPDSTPQGYYAASAFSYLAAMLSSNSALQYVTYPTQVIGKSCKPIPIMVFGVLFAAKKYPLQKYLFILLIVLGVSMFMYKDGKGAGDVPFQFGFGEAFLLFSLAMDGTTGAIQDRVRAAHAPKGDHMMLNMNLWSCGYLLIGLIVTGEVLDFVLFVQKFPFVVVDMITFSVASALGQYFIFVTVTEFGPLTCSIVTTTRKFFTVLASVLYFQNPMSVRQWIATVLIFVGLSLDSAYGKAKKHPH